MYGWRARIGYISAGTGEIACEELFRAVPDGVEVLHGNLFLREDDQADYASAPAALEEIARRLAETAEVDILVIAGYSLPALLWSQGAAGAQSGERELVPRLEYLTKKPVITGVMAQVEAMRLLQVKRPVVIVPGPVEAFPEFMNHLLEKNIEVATLRGLDIAAFNAPYRVPLHVSYRFAKEAFLNCPGADCVLFPESTIAAAPNVVPLEQDLGVPVLLDSLCCLWHSLQKMHVRELPAKGGILFQHS